ncbi:MAG: hypothetical protein KC931_05825 [Candidatus Omnitrophica bacterium]|nr:hypothetical protein [Candidatus Omnitrophota bacterium]
MPFKNTAHLLAAAVFACALSIAPAHAVFHLWDISEIYTNADGTIQYIELFTTSNSQQFLTDHDIKATQGGETNTFIFPSDSGSPTANQHLLIATSGFSALPGAVTPDFILPDGFLFTPNGTVDFAGVDSQTYATIPTDGVMSLHYPGGTVSANSPTNFAGDVGSIDAGGGGETPTFTPTSTPTDTPTATETPTSTDTEMATETFTATPTETFTASPTETATLTETETPSPTETDSGTTPTNTRSADIDGIPGVDARDLILFLEEWRKQAFGAK